MDRPFVFINRLNKDRTNLDPLTSGPPLPLQVELTLSVPRRARDAVETETILLPSDLIKELNLDLGLKTKTLLLADRVRLMTLLPVEKSPFELSIFNWKEPLPNNPSWLVISTPPSIVPRLQQTLFGRTTLRARKGTSIVADLAARA